MFDDEQMYERTEEYIAKLEKDLKEAKSQLASVKYLNADEVEHIIGSINTNQEKVQAICNLAIPDIDRDKIIEVLKLPKGVVPVTTVVMGYPDEHPDLTDRLPLAGVVHYDVYHDYSEGDIDQIYQHKESLPLTKRLLEENQKETLAQIFTDKRYTLKDNVAFSKNLLRVLEMQGFMNNERTE